MKKALLISLVGLFLACYVLPVSAQESAPRVQMKGQKKTPPKRTKTNVVSTKPIDTKAVDTKVVKKK
jgi:hypothetical protein